MELKVVFIVLCSILFVKYVDGQQRCYSCGFSTLDTDRSCLTITNSTPTVNCRYTYCTIMRIEYMDPPGQINSFLRGCEASPDYLNHEVVDSTFRTFYRACTTSLCNIGNGIQSVVGGNLSPRPEFSGDNILVQGTGRSDSSALKFNIFTIGASLIILIYNVL